MGYGTVRAKCGQCGRVSRGLSRFARHYCQHGGAGRDTITVWARFVAVAVAVAALAVLIWYSSP